MQVSKYHNQTSAELRKQLKALDGQIGDMMAVRCQIMMVLHERGDLKPQDKVGPYFWFAFIARGELSPAIALLYGDGRIAQSICRRLAAGVPLDQQNRLAAGQTFAIADHDDKGEIISASKRADQMTLRQLELLIDDGRIRTFEQQKPLLGARAAPERRRSNVARTWRADSAKGELICGQMRIKPAELSTPLRALGFEIRRISQGRARGS
jgi:hypothetical protein